MPPPCWSWSTPGKPFDLLLLAGQSNLSSVGMHFHSFGEFATKYNIEELGRAGSLTEALGLLDEHRPGLPIPCYFIIVPCFDLDHAHTILSVTTKNIMQTPAY